MIASLGKISTAMKVFGQWAAARGLKPSKTAYVARTRDRRALRFSKSGDEGIERAYRTHWVSPGLSERRRARLAERQSRPPDLVVVSPVKEWTCAGCGSEDGEWLIMDQAGPVCMACADMDHLVFLPSGDAALTRRAKQNSRLSAVVVRFSRARKRYERQGILVEEEALERAEQDCLADEESRGGGATGTQHASPPGTSSCKRGSRSRPASCSRAARPGVPRRSPDRPRGAAAAGLDAPRPAAHWVGRRSSWR